MKTIEERAKEYSKKQCVKPVAYNSYITGATEQKAIDDEEIKQLYSIMEKSASILGIGTKWFNDDARLNAFAELREMILNYLSD